LRGAEQKWRPLIRLTAHEARNTEAHSSRPLAKKVRRCCTDNPACWFLPNQDVHIAVFQDFADGGVVDADDGVIARVPVARWR
jgi:hypothetical protein